MRHQRRGRQNTLVGRRRVEVEPRVGSFTGKAVFCVIVVAPAPWNGGAGIVAAVLVRRAVVQYKVVIAEKAVAQILPIRFTVLDDQKAEIRQQLKLVSRLIVVPVLASDANSQVVRVLKDAVVDCQRQRASVRNSASTFD